MIHVRNGWGQRGQTLILMLVSLLAAGLASASKEPPIQGITFHAEPGRLFVPVDEAARELRWKVERDGAGTVISVSGKAVEPARLRQLTDGTALASLEDLRDWGAVVVPGADGVAATVRRAWYDFTVVAGEQQVEISLSQQRLRAWQGGRLVLQTRISSGKKRGSTPSGEFRAGPFRSKMHYSSRYQNAPMPWSVQVRGHVFIHGFTSVPDFPASHGCIRVPLTDGNPARFFFEWVLTGTPVRIAP